MNELFQILSPDNHIYQFLLAVLLGAFVGLRRELEAQNKKKESFMGFRTMSLMSSLGVVSTFFPEMPYLPAVCFVGLLMFLGIAYANGTFRLKLIGMTSEISALFMFWVGVLIGYEQQVLAVILTVFIGSLNAFKEELHHFAGTISPKEWSGALQLLILSGAVLPFLPQQPVDPWGVLVPFNIWFLVILISAIGFLGYFSTKYMGVKGGIPLVAFLGSIVSSTAVTTSLADQSKRSKLTGIFTVGILLAVATMNIRVAAEIIFWGTPAMIQSLVFIPLFMFFAGLVAASYFFHETNKKHQFSTKTKGMTSELHLQSPFEIVPALKFGGIFVVVLIALALGQKYLGDSGVYAAAFFSGFVDVDAIVLSTLESVKLGEMPQPLAERAIILAVMVNNAVKILYVAILGGRKLVAKVSMGIGFTIAAGFVAVFLF